jgi:hypothetical protein
LHLKQKKGGRAHAVHWQSPATTVALRILFFGIWESQQASNNTQDEAG